MLNYCLFSILRNTDYNLFIEGLYLNYLNLKKLENNLQLCVKFTVKL